MARNVLLSVDLNSVSSDQRSKFNEALREAKWLKHSRLTTIWTAVFQESVSEAGALNTSKADVEKAAAAANIKSYDILIHVGDAKPTEYSKGPTLLSATR